MTRSGAARWRLPGLPGAREWLARGGGGFVSGQGVIQRRALDPKDTTGPRFRHPRREGLPNRLQTLRTDRPWTAWVMPQGTGTREPLADTGGMLRPLALAIAGLAEVYLRRRATGTTGRERVPDSH